MTYNPAVHHRHAMRLQGYNYSQSGAYFITLCTEKKQCLFGEIDKGELLPTWHGRAAVTCWQWLAQQYSFIELDLWVVMPNHFHGILVIHDEMESSGSQQGDSRTGGSRTAPTEAAILKRKTLGRLMGAFKTVSTKAVNTFYHTPGERFWQRSYYDHIIRNEADLKRIREYILTNPSRWEADDYYARE